MKNITTIMLALTLTGALYSQVNYKSFNPGLSNDTLLFDGDSPLRDFDKADNCPVKVTYSKGDVKGKKLVPKTVQFCTGPGILNVEEDGPIGANDVLAPGSTITTGDNSAVQLQMLDGSIMRVGPNSSFTLGDCNFDDQSSHLSIKDLMGEAWQSVQHALGGDVNYQMSTGDATAGVRGTKYSMESYISNGDTVTVLKVFEGTVEFRSSFDNSNDADAIAERNKKLGDDYLAGKITLDEYTRRIAETNTNTLDIKNNFTVSVTAGFTSTVKNREAPTGPKPFTPEDNPWYSDINFTK